MIEWWIPPVGALAFGLGAWIRSRVSWALYQRRERARREQSERKQRELTRLADALDMLSPDELREIGINNTLDLCTLEEREEVENFRRLVAA